MGEHGHEGDGGGQCAGLTMRGRHWLVFDHIDQAHATRRMINENLQSPATLGFTSAAAKPTKPVFSAVAEALPANVKLMTLTNNYATLFEGKLMLRLAHLYAVDEHPTLSKPATISLAAVFAKTGLKITSAVEMSLTGNMPLGEMDSEKLEWPTHDPTNGKMWHTSEHANAERTLMDKADPSLTITLRPMELRTLIVGFE